MQARRNNHVRDAIVAELQTKPIGVLMGLPEKIMVCPAYGLDGFAIYTKTSNYSAPEY